MLLVRRRETDNLAGTTAAAFALSLTGHEGSAIQNVNVPHREYKVVFVPLVKILTKHKVLRRYALADLKFFGVQPTDGLTVFSITYDSENGWETISGKAPDIDKELAAEVLQHLRKHKKAHQYGLVDMDASRQFGPRWLEVHTIEHPVQKGRFMLAKNKADLLLAWAAADGDDDIFLPGAKCCRCTQWSADIGEYFQCQRWGIVPCKDAFALFE